MPTTAFSEAVKNALQQEQQKKEKPKTGGKTNYRYEVEVDGNDRLDAIITLMTVGVDKKGEPKKNILQKLFILFSQQKILLQVRDDFMTDEYTLEEGIDKFLSHLNKTDALYVGSVGIPRLRSINSHKAILKAMIIEPKVMLAIKDGTFTFNTLYDALFSSRWRENALDIQKVKFVWATSDQLDCGYYYEDDPVKVMRKIVSIFSNYETDTTKKQFIKELKRIGVTMDQIDPEILNVGLMLAEYFDVPFGAKCIKEYTENDDLNGLTSNALDELFCIRYGQRNYYIIGNGGSNSAVGYNYGLSYRNNRKEILEDVNGEYYVRFKDKRAFWEYITKRSFEEAYNMNLAMYIHEWREHLMLEIYLYNDVLNIYPSQCKYLKSDNDEEIRMLTRDKPLSSRRATNLNKGAQVYKAEQNGDLESKIKVVGDALEGDYQYYGRTYYFKCLRTKEEYEAEGKAQGNCVGDICLSRVLNGQHMAIFSLRQDDARDQSWITVDVDPFTGEFPSRVGRARKRGNAELNEDEKKLINFLERECMRKIKELNKKVIRSA